MTCASIMKEFVLEQELIDSEVSPAKQDEI